MPNSTKISLNPFFGVGREPKLVIEGGGELPPTVGHIIADAKISFISRIRNISSGFPARSSIRSLGTPHLALHVPNLT